jgi:hypothetical protein
VPGELEGMPKREFLKPGNGTGVWLHRPAPPSRSS